MTYSRLTLFAEISADLDITRKQSVWKQKRVIPQGTVLLIEDLMGLGGDLIVFHPDGPGEISAYQMSFV